MLTSLQCDQSNMSWLQNANSAVNFFTFFSAWAWNQFSTIYIFYIYWHCVSNQRSLHHLATFQCDGQLGITRQKCLCSFLNIGVLQVPSWNLRLSWVAEKQEWACRLIVQGRSRVLVNSELHHQHKPLLHKHVHLHQRPSSASGMNIASDKVCAEQWIREAAVGLVGGAVQCTDSGCPQSMSQTSVHVNTVTATKAQPLTSYTGSEPPWGTNWETTKTLGLNSNLHAVWINPHCGVWMC